MGELLSCGYGLYDSSLLGRFLKDVLIDWDFFWQEVSCGLSGGAVELMLSGLSCKNYALYEINFVLLFDLVGSMGVSCLCALNSICLGSASDWKERSCLILFFR